MKMLLLAAVTALAFPAASSPCCSQPATLQTDFLSQERLATVRLKVSGMTCGGCAIATRAALRKLEGVRKAEVSYEHHRAVVTYDPAKVTVAQIIEAIGKAGFGARVTG